MKHILRILLALSITLPVQPLMAKTFKIATLSPDGSSWMQVMREATDAIEEQTQGRVKFKFYPGGVMGDDQAVLRKIRVKQLHGAALTAGSLSDLFPDNQVYMQALRFKNLKEITYVRQKMDEIILKGLEKAGIISFGFIDGGFAYIMASKPVASIEDVRNTKPWMPAGNQSARQATESFGIKPITLPIGDVLTGLQTGLIDTVAAPPVATVALQWHTQVQYLVEMPLVFSYAQIVMSDSAFNSIKKNDQEIVRKLLTEASNTISENNHKDNLGALAALKNQGIKFIKPTIDQLNAWTQSAHNATKILVDNGRLSKNIVDTLQMHINAFRQQAQ